VQHINKDFLNLGRLWGQFQRRGQQRQLGQKMNILREMGLGPGRLPRTPQRRRDRGVVVGRGGGRGFRKQDELFKESQMTDIDRLTDEVNAVIAKITALAKQKHTYTFSHDDGNDNGDDGNGDYGYDDGNSNPSMSADNDDNGNGNGNGNGDDEPDDDLEKLQKLGRSDQPRYPLDSSHAGLHYPEDDLTEALYHNDEDERPGDLQTTDHQTYTHHFQRAVDNVSRTEGCDRQEAMRRLRARYPGVADHGNIPVSKRAPGLVNSLVEAEMRKGCNAEIAAQRVAQAHGFRAFDNDADLINKRAWDLGSEFQKRAEYVYGNSAMDRCESLRATRLANPALFKRLQRA
jgi:hypothetical protein